MTIIKPQKNNWHSKFFLLVFLLLFLGAVFYIKEYNQLANGRYELENLKKVIAQLEEKNNDLKNELFKFTDPKRLSDLAQEKALVLERHPQYFNLNP